MGLIMQNPNYSRSNLAPHLGQPVRVAGWLQTWQASKKEPNKIGVLFENATLAIGLSGQTMQADHLWVYIWKSSLKKSMVANKIGRLDRGCFNGRLTGYTRSDGSKDIGVAAEISLLCWHDFMKISRTMINAGRWQALINLIDSDRILVNDPYSAAKHAPRMLAALAELREFAVMNLAKLMASRANNRGRPSALKFSDLL
jgi:hypothetical protein